MTDIKLKDKIYAHPARTVNASPLPNPVHRKVQIKAKALWISVLLMYSPYTAQAQAPLEIDIPQNAKTGGIKTGVRVFTPDYFTQFQTNTAQEMVSVLPGFTLQDENEGARGFGQANLNILINGRRPSSKSSDANQILGRITAERVLKIEILDGASLDIPGLSGQVANIVTTGGALSGNWRYNYRLAEGTQPQNLEGEISVTGSKGALEYVASFRAGQFTFAEDGIEQFFDGNGDLFEDRVEDIRFNGNRPRLSFNLTYAPENGHIANLNGSGSLFNRNFENREAFTAITAVGTNGQSISDSGEDEYTYEVSGDYAFPLGGGNLKFIGLHNFENSDNGNRFRLFETGTSAFESAFTDDVDEGEFIARSEYSFKTSPEHDWQVSAEGAFNFLDSVTEFSTTDDPLEISNVRVEEQRAEGNITHSWAVSDVLKLQSSFGAEYSELNVTTSEDPARRFFRPKGFVSLSYKASPRYTYRARIDREVGQLDFGTFVSNVNLSEDILNGGNIDIVPDQSWTGELEIERTDSQLFSGTVKVFIRLIEDPIDRILFADGSEGPGNLDSATEYGVESNVTWLLDDISPGLRIEAEGSLRESKIDDPVTNISRRINDTEIWNYEVEFRKDFPNSPWTIGGEISNWRQSPFFRLDQSFNFRTTHPSAELFLTHKNLFGIKASITLQNILKQKFRRIRSLYEPDRTGQLVERQIFERGRGRRLTIEISDTF